MAIHQFKVYHFHQYVEIIKQIGESKKISSCVPPVLWSRGHREQSWNLRPTLLRDVKLAPINNVNNASGRALEEELRKQHYIAKNFHFLDKEPKTDIEWYEVMQHHGVKTRLLDWSESEIHSLVFALECFFDNKRYRSLDRINSSPCVWVFDPIAWNMKAFEMLTSNTSIIDCCVDSLYKINFWNKREIKHRMKELQNVYNNYLSISSAGHLKGIFNLSSIIEMQQRLRQTDLVPLLKSGELYYCLFYLLLYIYLGNEQQRIHEVMPLSIVESYHSERIRAQKGAFTIFPYYEEDSRFKSAMNLGIPLDAMENMYNGNHFLYKIMLCNPDEIAFEVMNTGVNVSWLYPEMPVVANAIEQREIFR